LLESEKLAALGVLSSGIAHEINNPIGIVLGNAQMLRKKIEDKERNFTAESIEDMVKQIEINSKRCSNIITSLLQFSKRKEPVFIESDVNEIIERALEFTQSRLGSKAIEVSKKLQSPLPAVMADPVQLEQVFINFIINAEQSMGEQGRLRIRSCKCEAGEGRRESVRVSFSDSGSGMSEEVKRKIFDPFFTTKETGSGTGLGLSVSYGIIKAHNGNIEISSEKGKGTEISVVLPATGKA
jgi:two-component system NtrC family sensor kinase